MLKRFWLAAALVASIVGCDKAKNEAAAGSEAKIATLGKMNLTGLVRRADDDKPLAGATVRAIKLLDAQAISKLVEAVKVPDGKGGERGLVRIRIDQVHQHAAAYEVRTGDDGRFAIDADLQAYLLYVFGPGAAPGQPGAYSVQFWGINPETGELDLEHLIGKNGKLTQANDELRLAGGPTPPAVPVLAAESVPASAALPSGADPAVEPTKSDDTRPAETVPPAPNARFWATDISVVHTTGTLNKATPTADEIVPKDGKRYLEIEAELLTAQTTPVKLVMQVGFDSRDLPGCSTVDARAKTFVYDVVPNGTKVSYKLVPPSAYYKFFFAGTATLAEGKATVATDVTTALIVGSRDCTKAKPQRPFLATLTWDNAADLDLHITKVKLQDLKTLGSAAPVLDEANWMRRQGSTLSLDVDDLDGQGPETNGDAANSGDGDCYFVSVNAYSGTFPSMAVIDVMHVLEDSGISRVTARTLRRQITKQGEWWTVGVFPAACEAATVVASTTTAPVTTAPVGASASACGTYPAAVLARGSGESVFYATGKFGGKAVTWNCTYGISSRNDPSKQFSRYNYVASANNTMTPHVFCDSTVDGTIIETQVRFQQVPKASSDTSADGAPTTYPNVQIELRDTGDKVLVHGKTSTVAAKGATWGTGKAHIESIDFDWGMLSMKGCFSASWTETAAGAGDINGFFDIRW